MNGIPADVLDAPRFKDRREAARLLAQALSRYRGRRPLILGIPRGGVVVADVLARELEGDLDVMLVRKLRAPGASEFAIGSVTEQGLVFLNEGWERFVPEAYLQEEIAEAAALLRKRRDAFTPRRAPVPPAGRITIVVDDGIATGATMTAALRSLRESDAARVVAASAVAPPRIAETLRREADELIVLRTPEPFYAVSVFFEDFSEVTDEEVLGLLSNRPDRKEPQESPPDRSVPLYHGNFGLHHPRFPS